MAIRQEASPLCIPRLLETRAIENFDHPIILGRKKKPLSFGGLFLQAREIVQKLNALSVGRNDRVAAVLPNGPEMAAAFLTIASGASFAPLNPGYRASEFDFFLSDLKPTVLVIQAGTSSPATAVARDHGVPVIELLPTANGAAGSVSLKGHGRARASQVGFAAPDDIALILHTSGTTSRPKMVPLSHANLLASAQNIVASLRLTKEDRCLSLMPLFHIHGLIGAVLSSVVAGSSVICSTEFNAPEILDWLESFLPTWFTAVPAMHQAIVMQAKDNRKTINSALRLIRSCSAPLPARLLVELERLFNVPVIEAYGMTEASHQIASNPLPPNQRKIGSVGVATGTEISVVNESGDFLPQGETGEIVIRGSNVTRGYENNSAGNLNAFVRGWFRTGDLGYLDEHGYLFITGRIKEIINRGGEKISPAEVDKTLMEHPAVEYAATFPIRHSKLGEDVAAAVVLRSHASAGERDLQKFVAFRLADYKVPRRIVVVGEIPKSATGKLQRDRLAEKLGLAVLDTTENDPKDACVAPRTHVEEALAKIWAEVLRIEPIGIHDHFFNLGGDSVLAAQIISRVRNALQVELSFLAFFDAPTLAEMAALIERHERNSSDMQIPRLPRNLPLPLSFGQQRLWFFDQLEPGSSVYNRAVFLRLKGRIDRAALQDCLNQIARRHEILRTTFSSVDGRPHQVVALTSNISMSGTDLRDLPETNRESEARRLAIEEGLRSFSLSSDQLLRAKLLHLGDQENILVLTTHHIAFDGWSDGILFAELSALYKARVTGLPLALPELPIQYADFAGWQRTALTDDALREQRVYWQQQLAGAPFLFGLPTDRPRPPVRTFRGARYSGHLSESLSNALRILSRREGITLYMTLLAAFEAILGRYSSQNDTVIGTPIAGRTHAQTENLIGVFINTLALRIDLSGNPSFRELLRRARGVCLAAFAHSDLPFEKLVEAVRVGRDMSRNPLFQVMFQLRNAPEHALELPDVEIEELDFDTGLVKLDLALEVHERAGGLTCKFFYNTDLFDEPTIIQMGAYYQAILEAVVDNPERSLSDLTSSLQLTESIKSLPFTRPETDAISERSNLTRSQLLIWAGQKLQPETPLYNLPLAFHIDGDIDRSHFQSAFQTLINSSDALRTVIQEIDGVPQQTALCDVSYEIEFRDFSDHPEREAAVQAWMKTRCQILFDLERGFFECALIRVSERRFIWYLNLHHIIADSRSIELIYRHVARFYELSRAGSLEKRPELPEFKKYIHYDREDRYSYRCLEAENYWRTKLAAPSESLHFYGRKTVKKTTRIEKVPCELGPERTLKLKQLASSPNISVKTQNASLFNIFAAVLFTYLYRIAGSREPTVGTTFHNRRSSAFRNTIGLLMEVLPVRIAIAENETFLSLIRKIASEEYSAFRNCHPIRNSPQKRLFDVLLNYDPLSFPPFHDAPVCLERVHPGHENDSLALRVRDVAGGSNLVVDFEFHCDVFDEADKPRAIQHFLRIMDAFLENPHQSLDEVYLLSDPEKERMIVGFNESHCAPCNSLFLLQSLGAQVERAPHKPAVVFENQSLTFVQLDFKANQLAHYLRYRGVKPGAFVGLYTERSVEMIIGLLGILKSGAAYVPLDPSYPNDRLAFMVRGIRMPIVLSQSRVAARFPKRSADLICLDSEWISIAQMSQAPPAIEVSSNHLAYVVYTSGSSGRPKGVEITHGALANFIQYTGDMLALEPHDRVLQFASISFDAAVEEIFPTLVRGATLVLRTDAMLDSVPQFLEKCREWQITVLDLPTAYWHELSGTLYRENLSFPESIRLAIIGGERAIPERLSQWQAVVSERVRLLNTYGPTEGTVVSTTCEINPHERVSPSLAEVPIGRPICNVQTYILDKRLNPTPVGVCGELHIGGAGLARGYVNDPELTAQSFIPNPFTNASGARLYKTGDLARYLADGNIEFVGRVDDQVKIRGFRIELCEIETILRNHPAVRDVLVLAREDASNEKHLVAYIVGEGDAAISVSALRNFLKEKLPDYMLPSAYVFLKALPLASTGKVNRRALPEPGQSRPEQENSFVPPAIGEEEIIAGIWREVLQLQQVGAHDNFFDLGGHSLRAIQVVSRIREAFKIDLPLRVLFGAPTVAGLALSIRANAGKKLDPLEMVEIL